MGAADSKGQITPPETPVYLKYSHLKELSDPRSPMPCGSQRTPILKPEEKKQLIDPRSPSYSITRTPVYCIPEPEEDESVVYDVNTDHRPEEKGEDKFETVRPTGGQTEEVEQQTESSPEKVTNSTEFSDKGYLITKNQPNVIETKKKRRRKRGKKKMNNENKNQIISQKTANFDEQVSRSPLISRNNVSLYRNQSPSLDCLVKKTSGLSFKSKPRPISFPDLEALGKENLAATFSP